MAIFTHYGTGQRIGFTIVCVGFFLCLVGSIAPYWITAKTSINDVKVLNDVTDYFEDDGITLFDLNVGVWYYCVDYTLDSTCVNLYDTSNYKGPGKEDSKVEWINIVRCFVVINIILGLLSGLVACCRCMCCSGGRTICHGFLSFFSGIFGVAAFGIFFNNTKSLLNVPIAEVDYAWAGGLYTVGSCLLIIASFVLCCALPKENAYGMVSAVPNPGISVNVSNTNSNINQYNAGGPIQSFAPLPHAPGSQPPHNYPHGYQPMGQNPPPYNYNQPGYAMPPADHAYAK